MEIFAVFVFAFTSAKIAPCEISHYTVYRLDTRPSLRVQGSGFARLSSNMDSTDSKELTLLNRYYQVLCSIDSTMHRPIDRISILSNNLLVNVYIQNCIYNEAIILGCMVRSAS